jgi:SHO1 osmosensor
MSTPGNAGIGAGGGPPLPADSSLASDTAYPYKAKALYACACQNGPAFAFDLKTYHTIDTASPDDPNEISFSKGEVLDIIDKNGKWWQARKEDGTVGSK